MRSGARLNTPRLQHTNQKLNNQRNKGLKKKLKDLMGEFSELRARIHDEYREVETEERGVDVHVLLSKKRLFKTSNRP